MDHRHFKIYKPVGMLSQLDSGEERQLKKKHFLSELYPFPVNSMPIGRLDEKSEGLLLITTDGKLSDTINRSGVPKEYYVQLDGRITSDALLKLASGVEIGIFGRKYITKSCLAVLLTQPPQLPEANSILRIGAHRPTSWIGIVLREGKFRQIRKMTAAVGFPTVRLVRIRIGDITIDNMELGSVTELSGPILINSKISLP